LSLSYKPPRVAARAAAVAVFLAGCAAAVDHASAQSARNVIIFVADGLRHGSVNATDAPTLLKLRQTGVDFVNSHALFPTFTTPNASAIATGHYLGDTGDFSNTEYVGFPIFNDGNFGKTSGTPAPFLENDQVLGDVDEHFANGNFLDEEALLAAARKHGFNTAAIGKLGPVAIQDVTQVNPVAGQFTVPQTVILDDSTGSSSGVPVAQAIKDALTAAGLTLTPTPRNQPSGNVTTPGTLQANVGQQQWFAEATTKAVLPTFVQTGKPFVIVYWSRDPDGTQHNEGDSLNALVPGINGPTSKAGVKNADDNLKQILDYIAANPALKGKTDIFVTSDHGFATISKHEVDNAGHVSSGYSTSLTYLGSNGQPEVKPGWLPPGFLAIDLAHVMGLPLFDPDILVTINGVAQYEPVNPTQPSSATSRQRPSNGNGLIGGTGAVQDQIDARVIVAANGGSDLIYIPSHLVTLARQVVDFLSAQDYVDGLFVDPALGDIPGALPMSAINLKGSAQMPRPAIAVNFKTFSTDASNPFMTAVQIADSGLQEGQGMHGSLGRDNTFNNMAAVGPDFKVGFVDSAPVSNADIAITLANILNLSLPSKGALVGRVLSEALLGDIGAQHRIAAATAVSKAAANNKVTVLQYQQFDSQFYFDVACLLDSAAIRGARKQDLCRPANANLVTGVTP
jgi:hypothetical protein